MVHYISPAPLTFEVIDKILSKNYKLALSEDSKKLINDCKAYLDHKIESSAKPLYGITTGFGSLCKISISKEDLSQLQANLVMSHACSLGEPIHQDIIRLMLLLKAHALSLGKSGVQLVTVERIIDMCANCNCRTQVHRSSFYRIKRTGRDQCFVNRDIGICRNHNRMIQNLRTRNT